jgi:hypothetical protein
MGEIAKVEGRVMNATRVVSLDNSTRTNNSSTIIVMNLQSTLEFLPGVLTFLLNESFFCPASAHACVGEDWTSVAGCSRG